MVHNSLSAQVLTGLVTDEAGVPVGGLLLKVSHPNIPMVSYGQAYTGEDGRFTLTCGDWSVGELSIEGSFYVLTEAVTLSCPAEVSINVRYQPYGIDEVIVKGEAVPIIDKGDTIVYNVTKLQQASDQTVEDMLRRLPDVEISDDGMVSFRGRRIDRILINGESLALDHVLLTRTLTPEMLAKMEIRTKEDNTKLKEQLLDNSSLLVLDLELDDEVREKLFGQFSADGGWQDGRYRPNANGSAFTLQPKVKGLLFMNWDYFNRQEIDGDQLRELDATAYDAIFDLPANPELLRRRETYHTDIYGFEDYYRREPRILGASFTLKPTKKLTVKTALFYNYNRSFRAEAERLEILEREELENFRVVDDIHTQGDFKSRVVGTYKFDDRNWLTIKGFFRASGMTDNNRLSTAFASPYRFQDEITGRRGDVDLFYEHRGKNNWGYRLGYHFFSRTDEGNGRLAFQDTAYANLFLAAPPPVAGTDLQFGQTSTDAATNHSVNGLIKKDWGRFSVALSDTWMFNDLRISNNGFSPDGSLNPERNWSGSNQFSYVRHQPKISIGYIGAFLRIRINAGVDQLFTDERGGGQAITNPVLGGLFGINLSSYEEFSIEYRQSPANLPTNNIGIGVQLSGVDAWTLPVDRLLIADPQSNATLSLRSKRLKSKFGIDVEFTGVRGSIENANALRLVLNEPFFRESFFDFQSSTYVLGGLFVEWSPKKRPTTSVKWQSVVYQNWRENGENTTFTNRVRINSVEFTSDFRDRPFDLVASVFHRRFFVRTNEEDFQRRQQTLSTNLSLIGKLCQDRLLPSITYRSIEQLDGQLQPLRTFDLQLRYQKSNRLTLYGEANNVLNQNRQLRVEVDPLRIASSEVLLLPASVRLGIKVLLL